MPPKSNVDIAKEYVAKYPSIGDGNIVNLAQILWDFKYKIIEEVYKSLPQEIIIHSYMPSQNTEANQAWNAYRGAAIEAIRNIHI